MFLPITVFRVGKQPWYRRNDKAMGWGDRTRMGVTTRNISGHHLTIMRQPYVQELASMLVERLDEAANRKRALRWKLAVMASASLIVCPLTQMSPDW